MLDMIQRIADELDYYSDIKFFSYGGRGSFGSQWPACSAESFQEFATEAMRIIKDDENLKESLDSLQEVIENAETDSLGFKIVIYWRINLPEDHPLNSMDG